MNAYLSLMKTRYLNNLQYRAAAVSGCLTQVAWGLIHVLVFWAFYQTGADAPMSMQAVVSYTWLRQAFLALFMTWYYDREIMVAVHARRCGAFRSFCLRFCCPTPSGWRFPPVRAPVCCFF